MTDDEERTLARELQARADAIAVPWVPLRRRRPVGSGVAVVATLAAVLVAAVLAGGALNARRLSAVASPAPSSSTSAPSPTTGMPSALTPDAARMLVVNLGGQGIGLRTETEPAPFFRASGRLMLTYAVSADGKLAYWKAGRDDALPHELHVYDTGTRSDRTVLTLTDERGGSQGFMVWSTDGTGLALSVSDANAIFEGQSTRRPTRSSWRLFDVATGTVRTIGTISDAWYVPVSWDRRTGVATATATGGDRTQPTPYYVFDQARAGDSASALRLPAAINPFTVRADSGAQVALGIEDSTNDQPRKVLWVWPIADPGKAQRRAAEGRSVFGAMFRPGTTDIFTTVRAAAAGLAPMMIENWGPLGSAAPRAVAAQLPPVGLFSFVFRSDGTALVAGNSDLNDRRGALIDPVTGGTVGMPLADDVLASIAPTAAAVPSARPSFIVAGPPCPIGTVDALGAALGSRVLSIRLTAATGSCSIAASPPVRFLDATGAVILTTVTPSATNPPEIVRAFANGKNSAFLNLQWSNHGAEPGYRCTTIGPTVASVAVDIGRGFAFPDVLTVDIPTAQRFALCADPPENVTASVTGSRQ